MKLHLGSGKKRLKGYLSVDQEPSEGLDVTANISTLTMFEDRCVEEIYSSHALEYFDLLEADRVLKEWLRVLVPGGKLFVSVPNLKSLIEIYRGEEHGNGLPRIVGPLFGRWENPLSNETLYHKYVWDSQNLTKALERAGFVDIRNFDPVSYLSSIDPDFDDYSLAFFPHMDRDGIQVSLCLEATRARSNAASPQYI